MDELKKTLARISPRLMVCCLAIVSTTVMGIPTTSAAAVDAPYWIWTPDQPAGRVPQGDCYFRKTISLPEKFSGFIEIAADDTYEVYVNGREVGRGKSWEIFQQFDISSELKVGKNVIAVKVTNRNGSDAGLAGRVELTSTSGERTFVTNPTWKCNTSVWPLWTSSSYRDKRWKASKNLGSWGLTEPWTESDREEGADSNSKRSGNESDDKRDHDERRDEHNGDSDDALVDFPSPEFDEPKGADIADAPSKPTEKLSDGFRLPKNTVGDPVPRPPERDADLANKPDPADRLTKSTRKRQHATDGPNIKKGASRGDYPEFWIPDGFKVERVIDGETTGPIVAIAFNEFGELLVSQESGPLILFYESENGNGPTGVSYSQCCERIRNCQGITSISGRLFVVGDGPQGAGLYRLEDSDQDGRYESIVNLVEFNQMGEHGPHGVTLGPDGMVYVVIGNKTVTKTPFSQTSPLRNHYEGELFDVNKFEDPGGHASGVKAPGGGVLRVSQTGDRVELVAGGLRNAYDLAFNQDGELFVHDSDMEADDGLPWHRPTRFLHVVQGGEYGWRSGWSKWPEYYHDSVPAIRRTGRGSPSGMATYNHHRYPPKYHGALFSCDWSNGQLVAYRTRPKGASYHVDREVFLEGKPLNATDIAVGPDGWLYFSTGGRGTQGGVYRVVWTGPTPKSPTSDSMVGGVVRRPYYFTAWGRQVVSTLRQKDPARWDREIVNFVSSRNNPGVDRARGLAWMHLVGPPPSEDLLIRASKDENAALKKKAVDLLGLSGSPTAVERLRELLSEPEADVRRHVCEALARTRKTAPLESLAPLLKSRDRFESFAAYRTLENDSSVDWYEEVLATEDRRLFIEGATAMMTAFPQPDVAIRIIDRVAEHSQSFVSDADFVDMVRVMQLAIERNQLKPHEISDACRWLIQEFPAGDSAINRELVRLLVFLQYPEVHDRYLAYLNSEEVGNMDKIHLAMHLSFVSHNWSHEQKLALIGMYDFAGNVEGGANVRGYLQAASRRFAKALTPNERLMILAQSKDFPSAALDVLFAMPDIVGPETVEKLAETYRSLGKIKGQPYDRLRSGIIAVMASSQNPKAMAYLREIYDRDPERRQAIAMGLAQQPNGRNWDYLVRSFPILEGGFGAEVVQQLQNSSYAPENSEHLRQLILLGLRLGNQGGDQAAALLEHWTGEKPTIYGETWDKKLAGWQRWYQKSYPYGPQATIPVQSGYDRWSYDELLSYLEGDQAAEASSTAGAAVFRKAQCATCHRFGTFGGNHGPDLTAVASRFQVREILESIIHPSQVISDQYKSHTIELNDGRVFTGLLAPAAGGNVVVMQTNGQTAHVKEADIIDLRASNVSSMPAGLLNDLSLQEIADLFVFLSNQTKDAPSIAGNRGRSATQKR